MIDQTNEAAMRARAYQLLEAQRGDRGERQGNLEAPPGDATDAPCSTGVEETGNQGRPSHEDGVSPHPTQDGPVEVRPRRVTPE